MNKIQELILEPDSNQYTIYPIKYHDIWEMYKQAIANFWTVEEIQMESDLNDWHALSDSERHFISYILAFFAGSDGIVLENLVLRFISEIGPNEAKFFYTFQAAIESIHSECYSLLIDTYISDPKEKHKLFQAIDNIPCIQKKAAWALKWIGQKNPYQDLQYHSRQKLLQALNMSKNLYELTGFCKLKIPNEIDYKDTINEIISNINCQDESFAKRLIAFIAVEGIFFSGSFCALFWLKKRGIMPGLTMSNELIARDEGLHADFGCLMYAKLESKLSEQAVHTIIKESVSIEKEFITEALPCHLIGMNTKLMSQYIEYVADRICEQLGYKKIWHASNPFDFMDWISHQGKTNFFERKVTEYKKSGLLTDPSQNNIRFDVDF